MMLEMENRKLDMAHEQGGLDDERYQRQKAILAAQGEAPKNRRVSSSRGRPVWSVPVGGGSALSSAETLDAPRYDPYQS